MAAARSLRLTTAVRDELLAGARAAAPDESVALLAGPAPDLATVSLPLPNQVSGPGFFVPPRALFEALQTIETRGLRLVATCHSHPGGGPALSAEDVRYLGNWDCPHLIAAVDAADPAADRLAAHRIESEAAQPVELRYVAPRSDGRQDLV